MRRQLSDGRWVDLAMVPDLETELFEVSRLACGACGHGYAMRVQYYLAADRVDELLLECRGCRRQRTVFFGFER